MSMLNQRLDAIPVVLWPRTLRVMYQKLRMPTASGTYRGVPGINEFCASTFYPTLQQEVSPNRFYNAVFLPGSG